MPFTKSARDLQVVDPVLSSLARRYTPEGFIYSQLFPTIDVDKDSGLYPVFDDAYWFSDDVDNKVSDRAETPEVDFTWSTEPYLAEDYRLQTTVTRKERRQAHASLRLEQNKLEYLLTRMAMRRERRGAALLRDVSNGGQLTGGVSTPTVKWNAGTTANPATIEKDIKAGKLAVYNKTARVPNTLVLPYLVAAEIAVDPTIREILKYTVNAREVLSTGEFVLPSVLWGMKVVIPQGAMVNTAREGGAKTLAEIYGDSVRLLYVAANGGGWGIPSVAYSFKALPEEVDRFRTDDPPVDHIRAWECVTEKVCAPDVGFEINDVLG
jgi:hypothetical protein